MPTPIIRGATIADYDAVLSLNLASVSVLSPMDRARLELLTTMTELFWIVEVEGQVAAFLLAFTDNKTYDSVNYQWFSKRLKQFLYIDRIVIGEKFRRRGIASQIYQALKNYAQSQQLHWLCAEIDLKPANPPSIAFHQQQGFIEIGQQQLVGKEKSVSLMACQVIPIRIIV
ncbi:GNAT family N-acetyltransferase [Thalassotalea euphylliae]|uniref:GNAT family N-acetyltransferase n=1 Tax=Thalassotalea euphylliae TaxID=1655234 RepID=A0A3E0UC69_9GAMM|nr:GNAT family N-acetyltransferase [Thalassotalea euphylliae]REL34440.1 GNAT family N-acetyltransferase [Thalassotalea euphylliae]